MAANNVLATAEERDITEDITRTEFWNALAKDVFGARKGGAIILVDAENARKGVAKTSAATAMAQLLSAVFGYRLKKDDLTLSGAEYLKRYQEHPGQEQPSVLILDEFVGGGAGDARRSMSQQNVEFGRAWQLLRTKRVITLATLPDSNDSDKRLRKLADYRMWCREEPIGSFNAYKSVVPFGSSQAKWQGLHRYKNSGARRIQFPNMDAENDPFYNHLTKKKDNLIHANTWNADVVEGDAEEEEDTTIEIEEARKQKAIQYAIMLYEPWNDDNKTTYQEIADTFTDMFPEDGMDYQKSWIGNRIREWRNGEHRELVVDPTEEGEK